MQRNKPDLMETIYSKATIAINEEILVYLDLIKQSDGFQKLETKLFGNIDTARLFANGLGVEIPDDVQDYGNWLISEHQRKIAVKFDIEGAVTYGVYRKVRDYVSSLYDKIEVITSGFSDISETHILANPWSIPIFQNILGLSKAQLIKKVGSVSDSSISKPAAKRFSELLNEKVKSLTITKSNTLQRLEITIEGIVRDLVGRILFEEVVATALSKEEVPFLREDQYSGLSGVVYNIRADFVIPNEKDPIAFIEVRKSSSRHASLYAKDKMFSAINWKGKHKNLIGVIIVEGDWTQASLQVMATIFDYVVPLEKINDLAKILKLAVSGDDRILKWLIEFSITKSPNFK
jgi:hypothetical protein